MSEGPPRRRVDRRTGDAPTQGPSGRLRRDPRAELACPAIPAAGTGPTGRLRRDPRAEARGGRPTGPPASAGSRPKMVVAPACFLFVVPDLEDGRLSEHDRDLFGAARRFADKLNGAVIALAFCPEPPIDFGALGADRLLVLDDPAFAGYVPEARAAALHASLPALWPRYVLLPESLAGGDLGRRLGAMLGAAPAFNVQRLEPEQVACRGNGGRSDFLMPPPRILLVAPEIAEPVAGVRHEACRLDPPLLSILPPPRIIDRGLAPVDANAVPLAEADFIVSGGNGVTDWAAFHRVAAALGAAEGGSRVVVDAGLLPRDRQIGASGTLVEPRCYLAFGIAGAPQHLQGIARCQRVVAVNTDLHAEMIKRADLAVIADAQAVMPALEARVRAVREPVSEAFSRSGREPAPELIRGKAEGAPVQDARAPEPQREREYQSAGTGL